MPTCVLVVMQQDAARPLVTALRERGIEAAPCDSGDVAARLRSRPAGCVVLLDESGAQGVPTARCQAIRSIRPPSELAILVLGRSRERQDVLAAIRAGATDYVVVPAAPEQIALRVERAIAGIGGAAPPAAQRPANGTTAPQLSGDDLVLEHRKQQLRDSDPTPPGRARRLVTDSGKLVGFVPSAIRALSGLYRDGVGMTGIVEVVRRYSRGSTAVLRRAGLRAEEIEAARKDEEKLRQSIAKVGPSEVRAIVATLALRETTGPILRALGRDSSVTWQHLVACASLAHALAGRTQDADRDHAFLAGLLHDVGEMVFDAYMSDSADALPLLAASGDLTRIDAELAEFQSTHAELSASLAKQWELPAAVADAVRAHHRDPSTNGGAGNGLARILFVADNLAEALGLAPGRPQVIEDAAAEVYEKCGLTRVLDRELITGAVKRLRLICEEADIPMPAPEPPRAEPGLPVVIRVAEGANVLDPVRLLLERRGVRVLAAASLELCLETAGRAGAVVLARAGAREQLASDLALLRGGAAAPDAGTAAAGGGAPPRTNGKPRVICLVAAGVFESEESEESTSADAAACGAEILVSPWSGDALLSRLRADARPLR